ncbi:Thermophilic serine proteinase precursor [compost metagenome]
MARSTWGKVAGIAAAAAICAALITTLNSNPKERPVAPAKPQASGLSAGIPAGPQQEQKLKRMMLSQDLQATEQLSRLDTKAHLKELLNSRHNHSAQHIHDVAGKLRKTHDHFHSLIWMDLRHGKESNITESNGKLSSLTSSKQAREALTAAKKALKQGRSYESTTFAAGDKNYYIMAVPDRDHTHGVIAVMDHKILAKVRDHQRNNLRMIPYPKEGEYKVESVLPNTMKNITVKTGHDNANASHFYENEIVVRFRSDPTEQHMKKIMTALNCDKGRKLGNNYVFKSKHYNYKELKHYFTVNWDPLYTEPHYLYMTNETVTERPGFPNDLLFSEYQWNLPATETNKGWNLSRGSEDVIVGVVDTGVDLDHPDLQGQLLEGYNVVDSAQKPYDDVGHGTHVAGIISALVNNNEGVAGMTWYNKVLPVKALDQSGSGTTYSVAEGIIWAADHGAKVINMSLGNYVDSEFLHDAVKYAYDKDIVLIAATGNDNTERPGYPAAYPEVFAVSATDENQKRASFSNYGDYVDVMAPGASIASTYPGNQYAALSGTSMASPHVAALAALIRSHNPKLKNHEVMDVMRQNVIDLGEPGHDKYFGYGQIDVYKALVAAKSKSSALQFWPQQLRDKLNAILRRHY